MNIIPKDFSDIDIEVEDKIYHLHKIILCQLPFFSKLFKGEFGDRDSKLIKIEATVDAFESLIKQLYMHSLVQPREIPYVFTSKNTELAVYFGLEQEVEEYNYGINNKLKKQVMYFTKNKKLPQRFDINAAETFLRKESKIHIDAIPIDFIDALFVKNRNGFENIPLVCLHYHALKLIENKEDDCVWDFTGIYNELFNENVENISPNDALTRYIKEKIRKNRFTFTELENLKCVLEKEEECTGKYIKGLANFCEYYDILYLQDEIEFIIEDLCKDYGRCSDILEDWKTIKDPIKRIEELLIYY